MPSPNREIRLFHSQKFNRELRQDILEHYGGTPPKCDCCSEVEIQFLTLDHINGGGNIERRKKGGSASLFISLRKNGYPSGYRVLCYNCNNSIAYYGFCPHNEGYC